ncbi:DUF6541 family protein [Microbacterium trichothecenolyticum]|uniref:Glycosyltransferase RgtA/B/C/D-like domain-containing protein n=1 Tax=Microbacterium trichothecenolyticum TaxID=69370 RepID=A0A0M2H460_MICTR|nr:DUF6541 family protein [Microbacterium trichothecenolyticum]KJL41227.1 hypothetical protein RS82_03144 [Microbacterium trichothecenolyticum]
MTDWIPAVAPILVAAAVLIVPGYAAVRVLGFRGLHAWAFAGPVSVTILAAASLISPLIGLPWTLVGPALVTVAACAVAAILRFSLRSRFAMLGLQPIGRGVLAAALAIGGALITVQFVLIVGDPENISQTFDNIFHLNAARYILDTQNASPLSVSQLTRTQSTGITFYPAVWHAAVALVAEVTGVSVGVASNAVMIAAGALIWPAGVMLLGIALFGRSRAFTMAVGILSAAAPAFPILMIDYGVLFPYFLSLCALPVTIAASLATLGLIDRSPSRGVAPWLVVLVATVPGLLMVHPAAFMAWLLLTAVAAIVAYVLLLRRRPGRRTVWLASGSLAAAGVIGLLLWRALRPGIPEDIWYPSQTPGQAIGEALTMSMERGQIPIVLAIAVLAGAIIAWRGRSTRGRLAVGFLVLLMALFVTATSMQWLWLRKIIVGAWYVNSPRLAALIPIIAIPLAAVAIVALWRWFVGRGPGRRATPGTAPYISLAAGASIALILATQLIAIPAAIEKARLMYIPTDASPLLTPDERALIDMLPTLVPDDAVIAGNPGTGTAMAYALTGVKVLHPGVVIEMTDDITLIDDEANDAEPGSAVCDALERTGVDYVLDFGTQEINGESHPYPGFQNLGRSSAAELVERVGDAKLFRIVGCDRG